MFKLIQLEVKKYSFTRTIRNAFIANFIISAFFIWVVFVESNMTGGQVIFQHYIDAFAQTEEIIRAVFVIFEAVVIARLVVDEYRNKTFDVIFTYPVSRQKIIIAKVLIIVLFSFSLFMISNILVNGSFYIASLFLNIISENLTGTILLISLKNFVLSSINYSLLGLIPLYFGVKRKSSTTSIVTSIIIIVVLSFGNKPFNLGSSPIVYWGLAFIGIIMTYIYIKNMEQEDLFN